MQTIDMNNCPDELGLLVILQEHRIPVDAWGKDGAKGVSDLLSEIVARESVLTKDQEGNLLREVRVVDLDVRHGNLKLRESRQVYQGGYVHARDLPNGVSEKLYFDEDPSAGARRALREELGIKTELGLSTRADMFETKESGSYPGLPTSYRKHLFRVTLSADQFKEDGYTERGAAKTTHFVWKEAPRQT